MPPITRKDGKGKHRNNVNSTNTAASVKILGLNDHCLAIIFGNLSPLDMCAVRDTCYRFRLLAEKQIELHYRTEVFVLNNVTRSEFKVQMQVFTKFCGVLKKLNLSMEEVEGRLEEIKLIFKIIELTRPTLDYLRLTISSSVLNVARVGLRHTLPNLQELELACANVDNVHCIKLEESIKQILKNCKKIEKFSLDALKTDYQGIFLQQKLTRLRSIGLFNVHRFDENNLKLFFKYNPQVEEFSLIIFLTETKLIDKLCRNVFTELRKMKKLGYHTVGTHSIDDNVNEELNFFVFYGMVPIVSKCSAEHLCNVDAFILNVLSDSDSLHGHVDHSSKNSSISHLTNWAIFTLIKLEINAQHIKDIIANCAKLKILNLRSCNPQRMINKELFLELVDLQGRKNATWPLMIKLTSSTLDVDVAGLIPSNILMKHSSVISFSH